jgi:hypothetical protein
MLAGLAAGAFASPAEAAGGIASFTVSDDQPLVYDADALVNLPDEHTTFIPRPTRIGGYRVFASSEIGGVGGAVALSTSDLTRFTFAFPKLGDTHVMISPLAFKQCDPANNTGFDENYAAPGTVVQDPTKAAGNLIMLYEAENHCPGGHWEQHFYATVGLALSSDNGKTWPPAINSATGSADRRPVLVAPEPEPNGPGGPALGNAIPSALVDNGNLYVTYLHPTTSTALDLIRVARASLSDPSLAFSKWQVPSGGGKGGFTSTGVGGGDSPVLRPEGCNGRRVMSEITKNDDLGLYLMVFVCNGSSTDGRGAWFFATATDLDKQNWSPIRKIEGSERKITGPCNMQTKSGTKFDGFYPSLVSPGAVAGHTKLTGFAFFLRGCDTALPRRFVARSFTITLVGPPPPPPPPIKCTNPITCCVLHGGTWEGGHCI